MGRNWIERHDGSIETLAEKAEVSIQPEDIFVIETPGGGGLAIALF